MALELVALREAGAESASAAEGQDSPSLKRQMWESDFDQAKRLSIEYDNELKIILDKRKDALDEIQQVSLTGMEGNIAKDLHEDSLSGLKFAVKHRATFMSQNTGTPSDAVDASLEEMMLKNEIQDDF